MIINNSVKCCNSQDYQKEQLKYRFMKNEKGWNGILENGLYSILFILTVHICFSIVEVSKAMTKSAVLLGN